MRSSPDTAKETVTTLPVRPSIHPSRAATPDDPVEVARYVAQITGELSALARSAQLDALVYFLEMTRLEAQTQSRSPRR